MKPTVIMGKRYTVPFYRVSSAQFQKEEEPTGIRCRHCGEGYAAHAAGKCLFESTSFGFTSVSEELQRWGSWYVSNHCAPYDLMENSVKDLVQEEDRRFLDILCGTAES